MATAEVGMVARWVVVGLEEEGRGVAARAAETEAAAMVAAAVAGV